MDKENKWGNARYMEYFPKDGAERTVVGELRYNKLYKGLVEGEGKSPVVLGLMERGKMKLLDIEDNSAIYIEGGYRTGKSWLMYNLLTTMVINHSYKDVQFMILDTNKDSMWETFSKFPHVLGYHTDSKKYLEVLREISKEALRREILLKEAGKIAREYRNNKDLPYLYIVVDDFGVIEEDIIKTYGKNSKELKGIKGEIKKLLEIGESVGIGFIIAGDGEYTLNLLELEGFTTRVILSKVDKKDTDYVYGYGTNGKWYTGYVQSKDGSVESFRNMKLVNTDKDGLRLILEKIALNQVKEGLKNGELDDKPCGTRYKESYTRGKTLRKIMMKLIDE